MKRPGRIPDESQTVEWKQSFGEWKEIIETCAAFATAEGGTIYVGVAPNGNPKGVTLGKKTLEDMANQIKMNTDPSQFPSIQIKGDPSSAIVEIRVEPDPIKPVWALGRPIKRVGRTNQFLKRHEAHRLLEISTGRTWDALPCDKFTRSDVSMKSVRDFLRRSDMPSNTPFQDVIRNLRLGDKRHISHAAALLFSDFPQRFFVGAKVKCARFLSGSLTEFLDERTFEGPLLHQLDEALAFVARNTRHALVISGKPQHDIVPEYPEAAVREAITNALCHRNYTDAGAIQIRIHDHGLEVWNPGKLPPDMTIGELYRQHGSHPPNPLLAGAVFRTRLIEQWGTGTLRIIAACRPQGITVEFEQKAGIFIVRLKKAETQEGGETTPEVAPEVAPEVTPEVMAMLAVMKGEVSRMVIQKTLGLKDEKHFREKYQQAAVALGLIEMTIPDKPRSRLQKYRLTAKGRHFLARQNSAS